MTIKDALSILGLTGSVTQDQIKRAYRECCSKYHPDRNPAGLEMMKAVNAAYAILKDLETAENDASAENFGESLNEVINEVINLDGIKIEICGNWVWLSGNTYPHREAIKAAGFKWASKKKQWYFRPEGYVKKSRSEWTPEKIRENFGAKEVKTKTNFIK